MANTAEFIDFVVGANQLGCAQVAIWCVRACVFLCRLYVERVHSQGRVLGDRSVLYKYVNPNLVVVVCTEGGSDQQQSDGVAVHLLDVVSGAVLHTGRHAHYTLPPAGAPLVVHCENWVVVSLASIGHITLMCVLVQYALWNEKARRIEMIVLEMYEGEYQTDANVFSSLAPTLSPPIVLRQSYIYPHSVIAMGVTNTGKHAGGRARMG
jgi:hypothetical protein